MKQFFIAFLVFVVCDNLQNYQQRIVYYSESENACVRSSDKIILKINLPEGRVASSDISGDTQCDDHILDIQRYAASIRVPALISKTTPDRQIDILMSQSYKKVFSVGLLHRFIVNVTINEPIRYGGLDYDCNIAGDGKEQHYGSWPGQPAATITLNCRQKTFYLTQ